MDEDEDLALKAKAIILAKRGAVGAPKAASAGPTRVPAPVEAQAPFDWGSAYQGGLAAPPESVAEKDPYAVPAPFAGPVMATGEESPELLKMLHIMSPLGAVPPAVAGVAGFAFNQPLEEVGQQFKRAGDFLTFKDNPRSSTSLPMAIAEIPAALLPVDLGLSKITAAFKAGQRVTVAIPEGVGEVVRLTPSGGLGVRIGERVVDTEVGAVQKMMAEAWEGVPKEPLAGPMDSLVDDVSRETPAALMAGDEAVSGLYPHGPAEGVPSVYPVLKGNESHARNFAAVARERGNEAAASMYDDLAERYASEAKKAMDGYDGSVVANEKLNRYYNPGGKFDKILEQQFPSAKELGFEPPPISGSRAVGTVIKESGRAEAKVAAQLERAEMTPSPTAATGAPGALPTPSPTPQADALLAGLSWLKHGRKGGIGGDDFAVEVQNLQGKVGNIPGIAKSEGARIRNAFSEIDKNPKEAYDAIFDNLFHGKEVPAEIRAKYGDALPALRRSLSDLQEIHKTLKSIDPEVIKEYPIWLKRLIEEPLESKALRSSGPGGSTVPGLSPVHQRKDAYASSVSNLSVRESREIIEKMPPHLRPEQPAAPGMSKGLVTGKDNPEWVGDAFGDYGRSDLKWPDTPEGKAGRAEFQSRVRADPRFREREITFTDENPIQPQEVVLEADDLMGDGVKQKVYSDKNLGGMDPNDALKEAVTPITDLPTVLSRSYAEVLRRKANEDFFATLPGMVDTSNNQALTKFVSHKGLLNRQTLDDLARDGYEVMRGDAGTLDRRWGVLNAGEQEGVKGVYAVRKDVADYLRESEKTQNALASATHGFLDAWAINATNAPKTGFMNWLYNKTVVDSINGNFPGSSHLRDGRRLVRTWEETGVMPDELKKAAEKGLPMMPPEKGMSSIEDKVDGIFSEAMETRSRAYDSGKRIYEAVGASPLAENPLEAAAGGFLQGAARGVAEGSSPFGILGEAALGAAETTALRKPAQWMREKYVNSDLFTTVGAYMKHYDDALKRGFEGDAAIQWAVDKTIDLTQAGQWSRVGGFSETLGAAPSGIAGGQHTGVRAIQKAFLNRFIKFTEVDTRLKMNAIKHGWKSGAGAALGGATIYGLKEGGRKAGEAMGIISPEESAFMDEALPEAVFVPVYDFEKGQPGMVAFPGKSVGVPLVDVPDSWREALSQVTGPGFVSTVNIIGGDKASSLLTGAPLRMNEPHEGTVEGTGEALVRNLQEQWTSPWASVGRYAGSLRNMGADAIEAPPGKTAPTPAMIGASGLLGPVRDADPVVLKDKAISAFHAQRLDIEKEGRRAGRAAVPSMFDASTKQSDQRVADLAEKYLDMGLKMFDLNLSEGVEAALLERGYER